jgi:uncharacterized membrane protein
MLPSLKPVLVLLILLQFAFGSSVQADAALDELGSTKLTVSAEYPESEGKEIYLNVSGTPKSIVVKDKTNLVIDHQVKNFGNYTMIYATVPLDYLKFDIVSDSFTKKEGAMWDFELILGSSQNMTFNGSLALPKGTVLKTTNGAVTAGEVLIISWAASNVDPQHNVRLKAGYEIEPLPADYSLIIFAAASVVFLAVILAYFLRSRPKEAIQAPREMPNELESNKVFKTLDELDKEIVLEIYRNKGKTTQAILYLNTHIPKATLSRRISSLESRGIIQKSQKGNRNLITLTDLLK